MRASVLKSVQGRRFVTIAAFLLVLIPITNGVERLHVSHVEQQAESQQAARVNAALTEAGREFDWIQTSLLDRARTIASSSTVIAALAAQEADAVRQVPEDLLGYIIGQRLDDREGIEVYDLDRRLVAWHGVDMPLDDAAGITNFHSTFRTAVSRDGTRRNALVVWWPVYHGESPVGAVRIVRVLQQRVPVQNQFLSDYDVASEWQRRFRLPMRLVLGADGPESASENSRLLQGRDGRELGRIVVEAPSSAQIVRGVQQRYNHVNAFWWCLLIVWITAGVWFWGTDFRSKERGVSSGTRLAVLISWLVALRMMLIELDVPARWQRGKAPLAPLFDPAHLASNFGAGILQSTGDLAITVVIVFLCAVLVIRYQAVGGPRRSLFRESRLISVNRLRLHAWAAVAAVTVVVLGLLLRQLTHRVVVDSTLEYFSRSALLPSAHVLVVFSALLIAALSAVFFAAAAMWPIIRMVHFEKLRRGVHPARSLVGWIAVFAAALAIAAAAGVVSALTAFVIAAIGAVSVQMALRVSRDDASDRLFLRSILSGMFVLSLLVYPLLFEGRTQQRRVEMLDAAETFAEGRDPRVMFAIGQALGNAAEHDNLQALLRQHPENTPPQVFDSLANVTMQNSLLGSLGGYEVGLTYVDAQGRPRGRYVELEPTPSRETLDDVDAVEFDILHQMYVESGVTGTMVEQVTGRRDPGRLQYEGLHPLRTQPDSEAYGWVVARAEPRPLLQDFTAPFPRVLLPASAYETLYAGMSITELRDGLIVRNVGPDFGRYRLPEEVWQALQTSREVWRHEQIEYQSYITYYRRLDRPAVHPLGHESVSVTAVRVPAVSTFDHLFYVLRVMTAGFILGLPLYIAGVVYRYRRGNFPAARVRFRDKVLNAFLTVGSVAVVAVGFVGLNLVVGENERAIDDWLKQQLDRVEEALVLEARYDEMPYRVLERVDVDSLAAQVGLDLNIYSGIWLRSTSRPQMTRERLLEGRLSPVAYRELFHNGFRFTTTHERIGSFNYTAGYRALPDEQGRPRYVISVPTLPEQERIEEERARTVAYLFGALLLLVLVVMLTASVLANALARPVARLREGLEAVARGQFHRPLPVDSRDEIGELVETFNDMQQQLVESRNQLALQERQLAWREMARQVAHEIKNPLTPMKLSVQHMQRAYQHEAGEHEDFGHGAGHDARPARSSKFDKLFHRITTTLIEQIDALARIADNFHTFARLPKRILETYDLNAAVDEAVALMQEGSAADVSSDQSADELLVRVDREELRRILINLIKNADQAIPDDRDGRITVRTWRERKDGADWALVEVVDNGSGIPEELQPRIFEPNFSTKTSGTGLGLAIVRKGVEEMSGEITFETTPGEGTRFKIRLPIDDGL